MKSRITLFLLFFFAFVIHTYAQEKVTLSGTITNKSNTETLIGATIYIPEAKVGITSNSYGFYTTTLPKGIYTIIISQTGFDNIEEKVTLSENTKMNFGMAESMKTIDEVVIQNTSTKSNIRKPEMSTASGRNKCAGRSIRIQCEGRIG